MTFWVTSENITGPSLLKMAHIKTKSATCITICFNYTTFLITHNLKTFLCMYVKKISIIREAVQLFIIIIIIIIIWNL